MHVLIMAVLVAAQAAFASNTITNYKSGISLVVDGVDGTDYAFERFYFDSTVNDQGVLYIRDTVAMRLEHNERNIRQYGSSPAFRDIYIGVNGEDGITGTGDEGIIRFKFDRDLQWHGVYWSAVAGSAYTAFTAPFSLSDIEYEPGVPLVGTTGPAPGFAWDHASRADYYYRGMEDEFGDEWHVLAYADDDEWALNSDTAPLSTSYKERFSSDGKTMLMVVNPQTPVLCFNTLDDSAQYYTTPAKMYFIPKIHTQISYVTDGVRIVLVNIMNTDPVSYAVNGGDVQTYSGPIDVSVLDDGENVLEYWYDDAHHKTRTIHRNPGYPSADEEHGYLVWKDDAEFEATKARIRSGGDVYGPRYSNAKEVAEEGPAEGKRGGLSGALGNALAAWVEGMDAVPSGKTVSYAASAKRKIMNSVRNLDPLGYELNHGSPPLPSKEINYRGYYDVNSVFDIALAYDLLAGRFMSDRYPGGITAIEDYKIRDILAEFVVTELMALGRYQGYTITANVCGMWPTARQIGALLCALAMPSYNTPYFGTSGFDGADASVAWVPFPNHPVTWKGVLYDENTTLFGYPDQALRFGVHEQIIDTAGVNADGKPIPAGSFRDRKGYYSYHLMGHCFYILSNVLKIRTGKTYPMLELSYDHANKGTLYGYKISTASDSLPAYYPQLLLINEHFPDLAAEAESHFTAGGDSLFDLEYEGYRAGVFSLLFYHDDWRDHVSGIDDRACEDAARTTGALNVPSGRYDITGARVPESRSATGVYLEIRDGAIMKTVITE